MYLLFPKRLKVPLPLDEGSSLPGNYKLEFDEENWILIHFFGFSAKNYSLIFRNIKDPTLYKQVNKIKGFVVTSVENVQKFSIDNLNEMISSLQNDKAEDVRIKVDQHRIYINGQNHSLASKVTQKIFSSKAFQEKRWYNSKINRTRTYFYGSTINDRYLYNREK